jgi:hypothetical protein
MKKKFFSPGVVRLVSLFVGLCLLSFVSVLPVAAASAQSQAALLVSVRVGDHPQENPAYNRVVFEFRGNLREVPSIRYVSRLYADPSGQEVKIRGERILLITLAQAAAHDDSGKSTVSSTHVTPNLSLMKEVSLVGDFESVLSFGFGLSRQAEIQRVFTLANPTRLVIDFTKK